MLDQRGEVWKSFVVMIPTLGAALIAVSRIMDARHHPFDVISGSSLGIAMAYISYRQYFPPLSESWRKGRAYPIRSWASEPRSPLPHPRKREVTRDSGIEPLRTNTIRLDEEQPNPASRRLSRQTSYAEPEVNVFLSTSERLRQAGFSHRPPHSASSSTEPEMHDRVPSFPRTNSARGRQRHDDGDWSSTSSDQGMDDELELQPRHRLSMSSGRSGDLHPAFRPKDFEQDTRYHSPIRSPKRASLPIQGLSRNENLTLPTSIRDAAAPRSGEEEQKVTEPKGLQLEESYR